MVGEDGDEDEQREQKIMHYGKIQWIWILV